MRSYEVSCAQQRQQTARNKKITFHLFSLICKSAYTVNFSVKKISIFIRATLWDTSFVHTWPKIQKILVHHMSSYFIWRLHKKSKVFLFIPFDNIMLILPCWLSLHFPVCCSWKSQTCIWYFPQYSFLKFCKMNWKNISMQPGLLKVNWKKCWDLTMTY